MAKYQIYQKIKGSKPTLYSRSKFKSRGSAMKVVLQDKKKINSLVSKGVFPKNGVWASSKFSVKKVKP